MPPVEDIEVYVPQQACVRTVPVCSLPSSITIKMSLCPVHTDRPATFITPVEVRKKGTNQRPRPLTSGQFFLPVVSSNRKAFILLKNFLHSGEILLQFSDAKQQAGSSFSSKKNSIVLFNKQIFLILSKNQVPDWSLDHQSSNSSEGKATPCNLSVNKNDITDKRRRNSSPDAVKDPGKCAQVLKENGCAGMNDSDEGNEAQTTVEDMNTPSASERIVKMEESRVRAEVGEDQSSLANAADNGATRSLRETCEPELANVGRCSKATRSAAETRTGNEASSSDNLKHSKNKDNITEAESSDAKAKCCRRVVLSVDQSPALTDVSRLQDESGAEGQINKLETPSVGIDVSISGTEVINNDHVSQKVTKAANYNTATYKSYNNVHMSKGQSLRLQSAVEIVDINNDNPVPHFRSGDLKEIMKKEFSEVENLLVKVENLKRRINDVVKPQEAHITERDDIAMEMEADCSDLIIVENDVDMEVEPNRCESDNVHQVKQIHATSKRENVVNGVVSALTKPGICDGAVEIIDVDDDLVLSTRANDINRNAESAESRSDSKARGYVGTLEIEELNENDCVIVNGTETVNSQVRRTGDEATGRKRRLFNRFNDETSSAAAAFAAQTSEVDVTSAKRWKHDDVNLLYGCKRTLSAADPDSQGKTDQHDVKIIALDDDNDKICRRVSVRSKSCINEQVGKNRGNGEDLSGEVIQCKRDVGVVDLCRHQSNGTESQGSLVKIKSCKRGISDGNRIYTQISEAEDSSTEQLKSGNVTHAGGKTREPFTKIQCSEEAEDPNELVKNENCNGKRSAVGIAVVHIDDQVSRESSQKLKLLEEENCLGVTDQSHIAAPIRHDGSQPNSHVLIQEHLETTNQGACGEEVGIRPHLMSFGTNQEFEYMVLNREEKINQLRIRLQVMEEELNRIKSHH